MKKVYIESIGCTRRKIDILKVRNLLLANGYSLTKNPRSSDLSIISTCAFKEEEEQRSLKRINYLKSRSKNLLVMGCLPKISPGKYEPYKSLTSISPKNITEINKFIPDLKIKIEELNDPNILNTSINSAEFSIAVKRFFTEFRFSSLFFYQIVNYFKKKILSGKDRVFYLSICRGCFGKCSYCGIKFAIGATTNKSFEEIIEELKEGIKKGYLKFVLMGDDTGSYGFNTELNFPILLNKIINYIDKFSPVKNVQIIIEELNPKWLLFYKNDFIELFKSNFIKEVFLPIQSGSDRILKLMKREHLSFELKELLNEIKKENKEISFHTQIMVGFPSEENTDYIKTLEFVKEIGFKSVIIFPYAEKENTYSLKIEPKIKEEEIARRVKYGLQYFKKSSVKAFLSCQ